MKGRISRANELHSYLWLETLTFRRDVIFASDGT
jgi:hypothetical protein